MSMCVWRRRNIKIAKNQKRRNVIRFVKKLNHETNGNATPKSFLFSIRSEWKKRVCNLIDRMTLEKSVNCTIVRRHGMGLRAVRGMWVYAVRQWIFHVVSVDAKKTKRSHSTNIFLWPAHPEEVKKANNPFYSVKRITTDRHIEHRERHFVRCYPQPFIWRRIQVEAEVRRKMAKGKINRKIE